MAAPAHMTAAEYFALDDASEIKHELVEGIPFAMAGGTPEHARLTLAVGIAIGPQLRGGSCTPFGSDLRVALKDDTYAYPDCTVVCGPLERLPDDSNTITNPKVVFEVLSPTTERYDRGRKAFLYQDIPTLETVVLVSATMAIVETLERQSDGSWVIRRYLGLDQIVPLPAIDARLDLAEIYNGVEFETP